MRGRNQRESDKLLVIKIIRLAFQANSRNLLFIFYLFVFVPSHHQLSQEIYSSVKRFLNIDIYTQLRTLLNSFFKEFFISIWKTLQIIQINLFCKNKFKS